ncbi:Mercuric resistance protein MerC [Paraburkholderia piptadeniae]|uniref:Mercuric resistance protein MerC n=1 Tax=Paraburkholderia piptadeniae TaxID=1701573 RepID=A0A1N7SNZ5_9BURK|nr:organomercurial transporter MerC [Paraburkholderia piptadeniae]SIT49143.1 Mercuric resistance protein MerC [Paraburkholderia piptadeniae]
MVLITRIADKAGLLGSIVSAMGCASCFPALAGLGAAIGLGFLAQWEGLFITTLIPLFAVLALLANVLGWFSHRQWHRMALGVIGPLLVLAAAMLMRFYGVPTARLLYVGLGFMLGVSVWDFVSPAVRHCGPDGCEEPGRRG